ncbi:protein FAR1-RELATED SEQUENCE 5-like [Andrographis paniculata]|uniref:protein FAR1-RELATED SEQUENCE 5-like n=1 Tax=Andrographis paniculata TaxID=175694 RepID=UPI0021E7F71C|nr:protein FAR1-RELATED SEQUENCE 5-like [Andrographis paniculata]
MKYCCNKAEFKEGSNVKPNHPEIHPNQSSESERIKIMHRSHETRTGYNSKIRLQFDKDNAKYKLTCFEDNHNHDLHPPKHKHMLEAGLPIRSSYVLMKIAAGGKENMGFLKLDLKNHMKKRRKEIFKEDEANAILQYFGQRSQNNPLFFYEIEVDYEDKIADIFWLDAKMREDYTLFGDSITFDTIYQTNKNHRPLRKHSQHFISINQHFIVN